MNKYNQYRQDASFQLNRKTLHPVWRGIGFLLMVLVPIGSYLGALEILKRNQTAHWFPIPTELIFRWFDPLLVVKIILSLLIVLVVYALLLLITFSMYSLFGPPRYGPTDSPPIDRETPLS